MSNIRATNSRSPNKGLVHIIGENGRTLCGRKLGTGLYTKWLEVDDSCNCSRCLKSSPSYIKPVNSTISTVFG